MSTAQMESTAAWTRAEPSSRAMVVAWVLAGVLLLCFLGGPPVTRTQEARVLETARQMLGEDLHNWLVPYLNGKPRLEKPPLCYWLSATSYTLFDVNEFAGRLPTALAGWLTIGLTMLLARRVFDERIALASGVALAGSFLFFRFTRLAETDAMATLFLTAAVYAIVRAATENRAAWHHLAAAATGMVVLAKGLPALFVIVFLIGFCAFERRWDVLRRFVRTGAPITFLLIACPWFIYVILDQGWDTFREELHTTTRGADHFNWPWDYIPGLLMASAPWSVMLPLALYDAIRRFRTNAGTRLMLLWFLAIFVPLCVNGNKQNHYLIMLAPAMMILVARLVIVWPRELAGPLRVVGAGMIVAGAGIALALPVVGRLVRGHFAGEDWIAAAVVGAASAAVLAVAVRRGILAGTAALLPAVAGVMPLLVGVWLPGVERFDIRDLAAQVRKIDDGPYVFYGSNFSLQLAFTLRSTIPVVPTADELLARDPPPDLVIAVTKYFADPPPVPAQFVHRAHIRLKEHAFDLYGRQTQP